MVNTCGNVQILIQAPPLFTTSCTSCIKPLGAIGQSLIYRRVCVRPAFWKGLVSDGRKDVNVVGCDYGVVSMANLGCYSPTSNRRPYRYTSCLDFNPQACIANVPGSKVPHFWNDCCTALEPVFSSSTQQGDKATTCRCIKPCLEKAGASNIPIIDIKCTKFQIKVPKLGNCDACI